MEILPVNLDELVAKETRPFDELGIKQLKFPELEATTYRIFFMDGSHEDIQAENASEAFAGCGRDDLARIVNLKHAYDFILQQDVIQPSDTTVKPPINLDAISSEPDTVEIQEPEPGVFEAMSFADISVMEQTAAHASEEAVSDESYETSVEDAVAPEVDVEEQDAE